MVNLNLDLPEGFLDEEVRCGYTISHEMKELWAVELDLLNEFQRVCNEYGLKYYACGGTLLGTIRHKGFIPWDDDIDVAMFRKDYERLKEVGSRAFKESYFLQSTYNDKIVRQHMQLRRDGTTAFVKATDFGKKYHRGIFIDIFVYDEIPSDEVEFRMFRKKISDYYHKITDAIIDLSIYKIKGVRGLLHVGKEIIKHIFLFATEGGEKKAYKKYEEMVQSYNGKGTGTIANISFLCDKKKVNMYKEENFQKTVILPFEHINVACPIGYDDNLRSQYGNYREFVTGATMHGDLFIDVDKSYEEYESISFDEFCNLFE